MSVRHAKMARSLCFLCRKVRHSARLVVSPFRWMVLRVQDIHWHDFRTGNADVAILRENTPLLSVVVLSTVVLYFAFILWSEVALKRKMCDHGISPLSVKLLPGKTPVTSRHILLGCFVEVFTLLSVLLSVHVATVLPQSDQRGWLLSALVGAQWYPFGLLVSALAYMLVLQLQTPFRDSLHFVPHVFCLFLSGLRYDFGNWRVCLLLNLSALQHGLRARGGRASVVLPTCMVQCCLDVE